jgi:hypothetical protein
MVHDMRVQCLNLPVHMLKRFSTLLVSILCILPTSTVRTGAANLVGMTAYVCDVVELDE